MNRVLTVHLELVHVDLVEVELPFAVPHEHGDVVPLPQPRVVPQSAGQVSLEKRGITISNVNLKSLNYKKLYFLMSRIDR